MRRDIVRVDALKGLELFQRVVVGVLLIVGDP